ncbi:MAG: hypothetical protein Q4D95_04910, partial [Peptoniphilus sp.]|nr:hypothetical protein [Peptoniphilus sp.]
TTHKHFNHSHTLSYSQTPQSTPYTFQTPKLPLPHSLTLQTPHLLPLKGRGKRYFKLPVANLKRIFYNVFRTYVLINS